MNIEDTFAEAVILGEPHPPAELSFVQHHMGCIGSILLEGLTQDPANLLMARTAMRCAKSLSLPPVQDVSRSKIVIGKTTGWWFSSQKASADRRILYLHGGGYTMGSVEDFSILLSWMAVKTKCAVLAVDYRLAPENPFPAALLDALTAFDYICKNGTSHRSAARKVFLAGDSAGGGMALALACVIRDKSDNRLDGIVGIAPWADIWLANQEDRVDPATIRIARANASFYIGEHSREHPLISPLHGSPQGLPPILLQVGDKDASGLADSVAYAKKAKDAGVDVRLEIWRFMPHVWHAFTPFLPDGEKAFDAIANFLTSIE